MVDQVLELFFRSIAYGVVWFKPYLPVICAAIAWLIPVLIIWNLVSAFRSGVENVRKLHRIPCARCRYGTRDYHLKCSVNPIEAFSEQAINCPDFAAGSGADAGYGVTPQT